MKSKQSMSDREFKKAKGLLRDFAIKKQPIADRLKYAANELEDIVSGMEEEIRLNIPSGYRINQVRAAIVISSSEDDLCHALKLLDYKQPEIKMPDEFTPEYIKELQQLYASTAQVLDERLSGFLQSVVLN